MKNITFSADERSIEDAREAARKRHTSLNDAFRAWLDEYSGRSGRIARALRTLDELHGAGDSGGRKFTRDEMNER